jgi:glycosyltransferase involved in cell wall biosynthesis
MAFVSLIVGFRDREPERIRYFAESLKSQSDQDFEVIFVDFGSGAEISEQAVAIISEFKFIKYYFFNTRGQFWNRSRSLNFGISKSAAEFVFTCDIDFVFHPHFISHLKQEKDRATAKYFRVGFMTKGQTSAGGSVSHYSDEDAVGAMLLSKEVLQEIGGFDENFEIWGLEDNDLKHRIEKSPYPIKFSGGSNDIFHVWHPPAKSTGILPNGWLKFLSDYLNEKKSTLASPSQRFISPLDPERPILNRSTSDKVDLQLDCGKHFLAQKLDEAFDQLKPGQLLEVKIRTEKFDRISNGGLNRFVRSVNRGMTTAGFPIRVVNANMQSYLSPIERDEVIAYFIKKNQQKISDYLLPEKNGNDLRVIKRP